MMRSKIETIKPSPRIGIIGSGAIGGFYGLLLARAGFEVNFLLRSEYEAIADHGLLVESRVFGNLRLEKVNAFRHVEDMPPSDWLLVGTKSTSNADIAPVIVQAAAPGAKILVMQNGLGVEDQLRPLLPSSLHLIGGLCYVCALRKAPGVIEHVALGDIHLGYHSGPAHSPDEQQAILEAGAALFRGTEINAEAAPNLTQERWHKLIFNVPFNGLSALLNAGTNTLASDPDSRELILDMMREVISGANQCGYPLSPELAEQSMTMTAALPDYLPSMYQDYAQGRPMELDAIYAAPLAAARAAGYAMPKVESLYRTLRFLDARHAPAHLPEADYELADDRQARYGD
jgi:2-dehydropantoate 2-reductase